MTKRKMRISGGGLMRLRRGPEGGGEEAERGRRWQGRSDAAAPRATSCGERLDYIAAMVAELKAMSAQANCQTLAGLLELAHREALQRRRGCP
jgi:hypothetical protein